MIRISLQRDNRSPMNIRFDRTIFEAEYPIVGIERISIRKTAIVYLALPCCITFSVNLPFISFSKSYTTVQLLDLRNLFVKL